MLMAVAMKMLESDEKFGPLNESLTPGSPSLETLTRTVTQRISGRLSEIDSPLTESVSRFKNNEDADDSASSSAEDSDPDHEIFMAQVLKHSPAFNTTHGTTLRGTHGTYR